jgi:glycosyltransferase involved in cell wall biosynthesis
MGLRVLMLTDFFRPIIGGQELHVERLSAALAARGHAVALATLRHGDSPAREERDGVRIYRLQGSVQRAATLFSQSGRRFAPPLPDPEALWALGEIIRRERPQIIHAHSWILHSVLPLKAWSGAKLLLTLHDYSLRCPTKTLLHHNVSQCDGPSLRKCLACGSRHYGQAKAAATMAAMGVTTLVEQALVDMFVPVSRAVADGNGLTGSSLPYRVISNFIPDQLPSLPGDELAPYLAQLPPAGYLLFVGALSANKGVGPLLEAYRRLPAAPPLVMIGANQGQDSLTPQEHVVQLRDWPHGAVMEAWRRCGLALVPSTWGEPCPTVVMEAMASGKPVVGTMTGGIPELVEDGVTGMLVPPGDSRALALAIATLLGQPDLAARLGVAGRERVRRFQASTVVAEIEELYLDVMGVGVEMGLHTRATGAHA